MPLPAPPPLGASALPAGTYAGQVVAVTGGGTGLGKGMALEFARLGAKVAILSRKPDHLAAGVAAMEAASKPALQADAFAREAAAYAAHLRQHIDKENMVLFPMAEQLVDPAVLLSLNEAFEAHEERVIGHGRHEQLHDMLKALKVKYQV